MRERHGERAGAADGGLRSTLWAGPESFARGMNRETQPVQGTGRKTPIGLKFGFSSQEYGYAIDLGLPPAIPPSISMFSSDPQIKVESLWTGELPSRTTVFAQRNGPTVRIRDKTGAWRQAFQGLAPFDSMMTHCSDPREAAEL